MIAPSSHFRLLTRAAAVVSLVVVAGHLGGCAGIGDSAVSGAFADPARYGQFDCDQLEKERKTLQARTAELQGLIDKARTGTAGTVVGEVAYRNDYISARAQANLVEESWQKNKCVASAVKPVPVAPAKPGARS